MKNGLLIFSAPIGQQEYHRQLVDEEHHELKLAFSISCTSRAPRGTEQNGVRVFLPVSRGIQVQD